MVNKLHISFIVVGQNHTTLETINTKMTTDDFKFIFKSYDDKKTIYLNFTQELEYKVLKVSTKFDTLKAYELYGADVTITRVL